MLPGRCALPASPGPGKSRKAIHGHSSQRSTSLAVTSGKIFGKRNTLMIVSRSEKISPQADIDSATMERCKAECVCPELVLPIVDKVVKVSDAERVAQLFSVLADPTRIRILHALSMSKELCVCDLAFLVDQITVGRQPSAPHSPDG